MENKKAGFVIRLFANIVDSLLLSLPSLLFLFGSGLGDKDLKDLIITSGWFIILFVIFYNIFSTLYSSYFTYKFGGTFGKLIAGIRVTDESGKNLTFKQSLFRYFIGYPVSGLLFGLGFYWIVRDPNKQGWHDQLTGSYVVIKNPTGLVRVIIVFIFLAVLNSYLVFTTVQNLFSNQPLKDDIKYIQDLNEGTTTLDSI